MKIGYARVSTEDQNPDLQLAALKQAGCKRVFTDKATGAHVQRPELVKCLKALAKDDILVVWKLDRLGRSLRDLISLLDDLKARGVAFRSLTEAIDTTTPTGRAMWQMVGILAELERSLIQERTRAGRAAAVARGVRMGRKPKLSPQQMTHARKLIELGSKLTSGEKTCGFLAFRSLSTAPLGKKPEIDLNTKHGSKTMPKNTNKIVSAQAATKSIANVLGTEIYGYLSEEQGEAPRYAIETGIVFAISFALLKDYVSGFFDFKTLGKEHKDYVVSLLDRIRQGKNTSEDKPDDSALTIPDQSLNQSSESRNSAMRNLVNALEALGFESPDAKERAEEISIIADEYLRSQDRKDV